MATLIENAAKGQRSAMATLYEASKQKVYFIAQCLLADKSQAENATVTVFKEAWPNLESAAIGTEEQFSNYVVCRVLDFCKGKLLKKNPKALRVPVNKNFLVPGKGYHGHGKEFCTSHRIHEETIDAQVMEYADLLRQCWQTEQAELRRLHKLWSLRQPMIEARIAELREEIRQDEEDIDELLMLKIQRGR